MLTVDLRAGPGVEPYLPPGASPRVVELVHPSGIVQIKRPKSDPEVLPGPPRWKYFHRAKPEADPEVLPGGKLFSVFHENVYPNKRIYSRARGSAARSAARRARWRGAARGGDAAARRSRRGAARAARCAPRGACGALIVRAARSARCAFCALRVLRTKSSNLQTY